MPESYDIVHTVTDYYDGPKRGIADFKGVPHFYESRWDEQDDGTGTFMLQPIDEIAAIVAPKLRVQPDIAFPVRGRFTTKPHGTEHSQSGWIVYWSEQENVA